MVQLIINNSYSQIIGLNTQEFSALKKILSYSIDSQAAYFSNNQFNTMRYLIDKNGFFPTGLLSDVRKFLSEKAIKHKRSELRVKPKGLPGMFKLKLAHKLYKAQEDATLAAVTQSHGIISMPTGTGKSLVIANIIASLNVKTLVVVPNLEIKKQLSETFKTCFGSLKNITIENIDSNALESSRNHDCVIVDEAHHEAAKTYQKLNKSVWGGIYYRFSITATPFRSNTEENILFKAIAGDLIYELKYKEAIKEGYIVPIEAYYIELPKQKIDAFTWAQVYSELVVNNQHRNNIIIDLMTQLDSSKISTLCLVKEIKHGEALGFPFVNGQDEDSRSLIDDFNKRRIYTLIGTNGVIGEGVDTKPCEYAIIAGLGKAKSAFMQQVGRTVRTYPGKESAKIIIFKDKSHKFTLRHFNEQCKILKEEYGIIPQKLDI